MHFLPRYIKKTYKQIVVAFNLNIYNSTRKNFDFNFNISKIINKKQYFTNLEIIAMLFLKELLNLTVKSPEIISHDVKYPRYTNKIVVNVYHKTSLNLKTFVARLKLSVRYSLTH